MKKTKQVLDILTYNIKPLIGFEFFFSALKFNEFCTIRYKWF